MVNNGDSFTFDPAEFMADIIGIDYNEFFINHVRNEVMRLRNNYVKLLFIHLIVAVRDYNDYFKFYSNCSFNEY